MHLITLFLEENFAVLFSLQSRAPLPRRVPSAPSWDSGCRLQFSSAGTQHCFSTILQCALKSWVHLSCVLFKIAKPPFPHIEDVSSLGMQEGMGTWASCRHGSGKPGIQCCAAPAPLLALCPSHRLSYFSFNSYWRQLPILSFFRSPRFWFYFFFNLMLMYRGDWL